jgi:HAD superfamily hydrolase (TIGR01458 family)
MGLEIAEDEVFTAPVAATGWLRSAGIERIQPLIAESTFDDFTDFDLVEDNPQAVLVGDLGSGFTFERLNAAFRSLRDGAALVAIHKNRFWIPTDGPTLDAGPFVAALEYAAGVTAVLVGKPAPAFFRAAVDLLGEDQDGIAVVGDDLESDIRGGRAAGLYTYQVRSGKYDPDATAEAPRSEAPDRVVDSLAEVVSVVLS